MVCMALAAAAASDAVAVLRSFALLISSMGLLLTAIGVSCASATELRPRRDATGADDRKAEVDEGTRPEPEKGGDDDT